MTQLRDLMNKAETAEQLAGICAIEAAAIQLAASCGAKSAGITEIYVDLRTRTASVEFLFDAEGRDTDTIEFSF